MDTTTNPKPQSGDADGVTVGDGKNSSEPPNDGKGRKFPTETAAIAGMLIALGSFGLSYWTYVETRPSSAIERAQNQQMQEIADRVFLMIGQAGTIESIRTRNISNTDRSLVALYTAMQLDAEGLRESLGRGLGLGGCPGCC